LFLIDACRGEESQQIVSKNVPKFDNTPLTLPKDSDIHIAYATTPGEYKHAFKTILFPYSSLL